MLKKYILSLLIIGLIPAPASAGLSMKQVSTTALHYAGQVFKTIDKARGLLGFAAGCYMSYLQMLPKNVWVNGVLSDNTKHLQSIERRLDIAKLAMTTAVILDLKNIFLTPGLPNKIPQGFIGSCLGMWAYSYYRYLCAKIYFMRHANTRSEFDVLDVEKMQKKK